MHVGRRQILFLILLVLAQTAAASDEDAYFKLSLEELTKIKVIYSASKYEQPLAEAPGAATIVTREEIRLYGYRTLGELLGAERGFSTHDDRNYLYLGVRGLENPSVNRRVLLLIDGHRANENYYDQPFLGTGFPVDIDLIDRVEIVRGPNSALYGTNAMAAIVNVVTRRDLAANRLETAVLAGSQDTGQARLTLASAGEAPRGWILSATGYRSAGDKRPYYPEFDTPATNNGIYEDNDDDEAVHVFGRYEGGRVVAGGYVSSRKKRIPTGSYGTVFNDPGTFTRDRQGHFDIDYQAETAGGLRYRGALTYDYFNYTGDYIYDNPPRTINRDETTVHTIGTEQLLGWTWSAHRLLAGCEFRSDVHYESRNIDVDPYALYVDNEGDSQVLGLFVQDRFKAGRVLEFTLGARYDEYFNLGGSFNPRAEVAFSPRPRTRIRLMGGQAYRAPTKTELEDAGPWRDNVGVGPEKLKSVELAWDETLSPHLVLTGSVYHYVMSDLITYGPTPLGGDGYLNAPGDVDVTGAEFEADYGRAAGWRAQGSVAYIGTATDNAVVTTNAPQWQFKARFSTPLLADRWRIAVHGVHTGERATAHGGRVAPHGVVNLSVHYLGWAERGWSVALLVRNLLDADYADPATEFHIQEQIPQDPFRIFLKVGFAL